MNHAARAPDVGVRPKARGHEVANRVIPAILGMPVLHRLLSRELMLITFTGRKSGRSFTVPVSYAPAGEGVLFFSNQRWWTNLRGGAPVILRLRGRTVSGYAEPVEDRVVVASEVRAYLQRRGVRRAGRIGVQLSGRNEPDDLAIEESVRNHVVVYVTWDHD